MHFVSHANCRKFAAHRRNNSETRQINLPQSPKHFFDRRNCPHPGRLYFRTHVGGVKGGIFPMMPAESQCVVRRGIQTPALLNSIRELKTTDDADDTDQ